MFAGTRVKIPRLSIVSSQWSKNRIDLLRGSCYSARRCCLIIELKACVILATLGFIYQIGLIITWCCSSSELFCSMCDSWLIPEFGEINNAFFVPVTKKTAFVAASHSTLGKFPFELDKECLFRFNMPGARLFKQCSAVPHIKHVSQDLPAFSLVNDSNDMGQEDIRNSSLKK